jgi:hypothetical protein
MRQIYKYPLTSLFWTVPKSWITWYVRYFVWKSVDVEYCFKSCKDQRVSSTFPFNHFEGFLGFIFQGYKSTYLQLL